MLPLRTFEAWCHLHIIYSVSEAAGRFFLKILDINYRKLWCFWSEKCWFNMKKSTLNLSRRNKNLGFVQGLGNPCPYFFQEGKIPPLIFFSGGRNPPSWKILGKWFPSLKSKILSLERVDFYHWQFSHICFNKNTLENEFIMYLGIFFKEI